MSFLDMLILRRWDIQQTDEAQEKDQSQGWSSGGPFTHVVVRSESQRLQLVPLELCSALAHIIGIAVVIIEDIFLKWV